MSDGIGGEDSGYIVYGQDSGRVIRDVVFERRVCRAWRSRRIERTHNPEAKRQAWERAKEIARRLRKEPRWTQIKITRFEPGQEWKVLFEALAGSKEWEKLGVE